MSFVIIPKKDPKKLQNLWAPSLTTVHISLVGWDQGAMAYLCGTVKIVAQYILQNFNLCGTVKTVVHYILRRFTLRLKTSLCSTF